MVDDHVFGFDDKELSDLVVFPAFKYLQFFVSKLFC